MGFRFDDVFSFVIRVSPLMGLWLWCCLGFLLAGRSYGAIRMPHLNGVIITFFSTVAITSAVKP